MKPRRVSQGEIKPRRLSQGEVKPRRLSEGEMAANLKPLIGGFLTQTGG